MSEKILKIDKEFKGLCAPLLPEEFRLLEDAIVRDGCTSPLSIWEETLLDGHHRYEICKRLDIPFGVVQIKLVTREEAINWIINNQLGRRNITPQQTSYLRGKRYSLEKKQTPNPEGINQYDEVKGKNCPQPEITANKLADELGVSPRTIKNDAQYADAIDTISGSLDEDVKDEILAGKSNLTKEETVKLAKGIKAAAKEPKPPPVESETEADTSSETKAEEKAVLGVPISEYAIKTEDGQVLFNKQAIAKAIADVKKNPGLPAEWHKHKKLVYRFFNTHDSGEIVDSLETDEQSLKYEIMHVERILNFFDDIMARIETKIKENNP